MKLQQDVSAEKLRGGFYTPPRLVDFCVDRAMLLLRGREGLTLLEPSVGDGAFLRGIARSSARERIQYLLGIEVVGEEAAKAQLSLRTAGLNGHVIVASSIAWSASARESFDAVVGNPPFVRYQFLSPEDKAAVGQLGQRLGITFGGVSNLWIPVLLGALSRVHPGGAFAVVVPTECFTGCSAAVARTWLLRHTKSLQFDLFPPGSFPGVLQEVTVMSGQRAGVTTGSGELTVVEHDRISGSRSWTQSVNLSAPNWMELLLEPDGRNALQTALSLPYVRPLASLARLEVSIVTGANDYFCVSDATMRAYNLEPWARPLLPRSRNSPGLRFRPEDQDAVKASGSKAWLLDFANSRPDPMDYAGPRRYLEMGEERQLHERYKCRIRSPWYRVPSVRSGDLLLSKRSHLYPRLIANEAGSLTTDTIYRGQLLEQGGLLKPDSAINVADLIAGFHSSLSLLTVELHGRSFGGGVLELVPSELARVAVIARPSLGEALDRLDAVARSEDPEALVEMTDALLVRSRVLPGDIVAELSKARRDLLDRRLDRNRADRVTVAEAA